MKIAFAVFFSLFASANPALERCLDELEQKNGRKVEWDDLKNLKKQCRSTSILPGASRGEAQRYDSYYLLCKDFWARRLRRQEVQDISAGLKRCHERATAYVKTIAPTGAFRCEVRSCQDALLGKHCIGKTMVYENVSEELCEKIIAPLKCTIEKRVPDFVQLKLHEGMVEVRCDSI